MVGKTMLLEICVDCIESALAAKAGGANRLEICGSLATGGITPSVGLIHHCRERCESLPATVMIRPHDGGFCYDDDEIGTMLRDIDVAKELGVRGVVFGALSQAGEIDREVVMRLLETARPLEVTFHRAFDLANDPLAALETLLELGVDRLLTSGQARSAEAGAGLIAKLVQRAEGRISVIAGAGISSANVAGICRLTGVKEIHASASVPRKETSDSEIELGSDASPRITSPEVVRRLVEAMPSL